MANRFSKYSVLLANYVFLFSCFFVGYGLYKQYASQRLHIGKKILRVYIDFWKVFFIFIPIAFLFFREQEQLTHYSSAYQTFDLNTFFLTVTGINVTAYNGEWWFVAAFAIATILGYLYILNCKKINNIYVEMFIVLIINILIYRILRIVINLPSLSSLASAVSTDPLYTKFLNQDGVVALFTGIVFAKYNALDKLMQHLDRIKTVPLIGIAIIFTISELYLRTFNGIDFYDFLITPFLIALYVSAINRIKVLQDLFGLLGQHSTNMWLVHSFFCYRFSIFVKMVFYSQNAVIDLFVLIGLSLATAVALDKFYSLLSHIWGKYNCSLTRKRANQ